LVFSCFQPRALVPAQPAAAHLPDEELPAAARHYAITHKKPRPIGGDRGRARIHQSRRRSDLWTVRGREREVGATDSAPVAHFLMLTQCGWATV